MCVYVRVDHCTLWLAYFVLFVFKMFFFCWCRWCCCLFFVGLLYWKYTKINERISSKKSNPNKYIYNKKKDHWPTITTTQNKTKTHTVGNQHTHTHSSSSSFIHNTVSDIWIDSIQLDSINKIRFRFGLFYWIQSTRENHLFLHCQYICPKTGGVFVCWNCQKKKTSSIRYVQILQNKQINDLFFFHRQNLFHHWLINYQI